jgi:hypothetical protein
MTKSAFWWLGAGAIVAGGMALAHPGHPPLPTPTITVSATQQSVPFELFRGNRIVVAARINGHETRVMLDTGASMSTLNRSYARSIGLPEGFKIQAKGAGGPVDAELVSGLTLELGGFHAQNASVGVMDLGPVERNLGMPISAIFGRDFFNSAVVSVDWANNRLSVQSHETFRPAADANALELTRRGPFNTIKVSIAGAPPIDALLDLGNGSPLVLPRSYWAGRPELTGLRSAAAVVGGVGGVHSARAALVPEITLAGATFNAVPAILSESGNDEDPTQMANVGIGLLKQFKVDLDLGRDRIYLTPRKDRPAFGRDRAGVRFDLAGDRLEASFVSQDGPAAAAGLKQGDEVTAVDGHPVTTKYYETADWTRAAAGRKVVLTRADGSKITVTLADYY